MSSDIHKIFHIFISNFLVYFSTNHPVHIVTEEKKLSPSALIPFCEFGENIEMGIKIDQFDDPVCNSFQAKIQNDQLCYEVDLNKFANKDNLNKALKSGLRFVLDYNEDRQVKKITESPPAKKNYGNVWFDRAALKLQLERKVRSPTEAPEDAEKTTDSASARAKQVSCDC